MSDTKIPILSRQLLLLMQCEIDVNMEKTDQQNKLKSPDVDYTNVDSRFSTKA
jgi:hypothetical protein